VASRSGRRATLDPESSRAHVDAPSPALRAHRAGVHRREAYAVLEPADTTLPASSLRFLGLERL